VSESNVVKLAPPGVFSDSLTEILRSGARALLTQAVEAEVAEFLAKHADLKTETGHQRVVRHGHLPEREIMTGIGPVAVRQPRVRDREAAEGERIRYSPSIVPRYARRSKSLEVLIPVLYLKACQPATSRKRWRPWSARTRQVYRRRPSSASRRRGPRSMRAGRSAICRSNATSIAGPTASIWRPGSRTRRSASWSSSARRRKARRNSSASPMACARVHNRGAICCSI
jgi:hypothetical protein